MTDPAVRHIQIASVRPRNLLDQLLGSKDRVVVSRDGVSGVRLGGVRCHNGCGVFGDGHSTAPCAGVKNRTIGRTGQGEHPAPEGSSILDDDGIVGGGVAVERPASPLQIFLEVRDGHGPFDVRVAAALRAATASAQVPA